MLSLWFSYLGFSIAFAFVLAMVLTDGSFLRAAEFRPIYAETVSGLDFHTDGGPVPYISSLSGDGSTIGGTVTLTRVDIDCAIYDCENTAFVWSIKDEQRLELGNVELTGTTFNMAYPRRVSGLSHDGRLALVTLAARHIETTIQDGNAVRALRDPIVVGEPLLGSGMSSDGKVVVGSIGNTPFLWTESTGLRSIPKLPADSELLPIAISGDGKSVALVDDGNLFGETIGSASQFRTAETAAIWNEAQGLQVLEPVSGNERAFISSINFDGSVVVGASSHFDGPGSFRILTATYWDKGSQAALNTVIGFDSTIATDVTADGAIVVGVARDEPADATQVSRRELRELRTRDRAVLWMNNEAFLLQDLLAASFGLEEQLEGWRLTSATAISDDGITIAGHGIDPAGNAAAWVAVLSVPEPGTASLIAGGMLLLASIRSRRR